jgi:uncharacterized OB-fold protein
MVERRPGRTLGGAHDTFWDWCARGELRLQHCAACEQFSWPPVEACEHCGDDGLAWERMSGRGTIMSWCSFERDYYGGILPLPWHTILVELEEGPLFISNRHARAAGLRRLRGWCRALQPAGVRARLERDKRVNRDETARPEPVEGLS